MRQVLIVEDSQELAMTIGQALEQKGLKITLVDNLDLARRMIRRRQFSLAILDRMLPDGDGLDLIEEILAINYQTKILVLTTRGETKEKILGFHQGADDYLSKPFSHQELMLRSESLLAKHKAYYQDVMSCVGLVLYPETGVLLLNHHQVRLRPKESKILACLIHHHQLIVTYSLLQDFVWGSSVTLPAKRSIGVYVRRIRMSLGSQSSRLKSIRGIGYRFD